MNLFDAEDQDEEYVRPEDNRCTPQKLLEWLLTLNQCPTLKDCLARFGGILGPMFDAWTLKEQGLWPTFPTEPKRRRR